SFLTAEHGTKRGVARSARTKFSRFAGVLQPLARARVGWMEKEGRELVRVSDVQLERPARALQDDLEGLLLGAYLAEHVTQMVLEDEPSERWFRLLDSTLVALEAGVPRKLATRYFEVWALRLSGVLPVPDVCPLCGRPLGDRASLLESEAAIVCPECAGAERQLPLSPSDLVFLRRTGRHALRDLAAETPTAAAGLDGATLERVERLVGRVRRHFLQGELKSRRVMHQTLGR
ncbi:MAG: DNA repair protein RecO, partial [Acidobacteriota bacterium]